MPADPTPPPSQAEPAPPASPKKAGKPKRKRTRKGKSGMRPELISIAWEMFCNRLLAVKAIALELNKAFGTSLTRESIYDGFKTAVEDGLFRYNPPPHIKLAAALRAVGTGVDINVLATGTFDGLVDAAAELIIERIQAVARDRRNSNRTVHVGFAGGHSMNRLVKRVRRLLLEPIRGLPENIVWHAVVGGFQVKKLTTDPNAFLIYFDDVPESHVKMSYVGLHVPCVVHSKDFATTRDLPGVKEAFEAANRIDILVTSASSWSDEHCLLHAFMNDYSESKKKLEAAGVVGDMLWQPLSANGPINMEDLEIRPVSLFDLSELPNRIAEQHMKVVLVLGPCGARDCGKSKPEVLKAILSYEPGLITDLVVDSITAEKTKALLDPSPSGPAAPNSCRDSG
ncbi:MAG: hypothetical protein JXR37_28260 [Kiritimatiellae bacterium]|nr:hypothetical protein [Kiritimatiellia bacterium]